MESPSKIARVVFLCAVAPLLTAACEADPGDDPKGDPASPLSPPPAPLGQPTSGGPASPPPAPQPSDAGGEKPKPPTSADAGPPVVDAATPNEASAPVDAATGDLRVRYLAGTTAPTTNEIRPHLDIANMGAVPQPLAELTARYWFTSDAVGAAPQTYACDYAAVGCANIKGKVIALAPARLRADAYFEIGFTSAAGAIAPGASTALIQTRFHKDDYSNYDQSNDYSFDATHAQLQDSPLVTLYRAGQLVWGIEPP